jgi:hypothetical protein
MQQGMLVLPGGIARFGWRGDGGRINIKNITDSLNYLHNVPLSLLLSINTNPTPKQLSIMEGLKKSFAQCKKEGRVSL